MKLHEGSLYTIAKRVNGGQWMAYGSTATQEEADRRVETNRDFHLSRCPNDNVEYSVTKVY